MHEFSLALSVIEIAKKEAEKAHASKVTSITLEIGDCAGVEMDAFKFAWPAATKGTILNDAKMVVKTIQGKALCIECDQTYTMKHLFDPCPNCGSYLKNICQGTDFRVDSITVI